MIYIPLYKLLAWQAHLCIKLKPLDVRNKHNHTTEGREKKDNKKYHHKEFEYS
ncbi:hypothetical protein [Ruminococcus bicirculans (ex Wegman et al. 2014)]|uniref:hypothetical protein n=1 Tax=Ruminococcus TaxID=1263 RepID=UPI00242A7808|nr:hypothetical protein [Ruminococcus bicirculans (ex Wegman et al. 2014)]